MANFFLPADQCAEPTLFLMGREAHHAQHVLRIRRGDRVNVLDGAGHEYGCEVDGLDRDKVRLRVLEKKFVPPLPWQITLLQALPKGKLIESIIQKATELGVWRIVPLQSERVVTRGSEKLEKWQSVAIEAIKQCGSPWLPQVETPVTPAQFLGRKEPVDLGLLGSLQPEARHPRTVLGEFQAQKGQPPKSLHVWIGPEGDFSPGEISAIKASGAESITMGRLVLRTETAAIYSLSVLNYELQYLAGGKKEGI